MCALASGLAERVEQARELVGRQHALLERELAHAPARCARPRPRARRRGRSRSPGASAVTIARLCSTSAAARSASRLDARRRSFSVEHARGARQEADATRAGCARHDRHHDVELELPCVAADRDRDVVADHLRRDLEHRLADHRVHLAGHDRRAGLDRGQRDLAEAAARPRAEPAHVVGDLGERRRRACSARRSPPRHASCAPCASKWSRASANGEPGARARARRARARRSRAGS